MTVFYQNLRAWRFHRGLTQAGLAESSGISRPNLAALERGRRECTLSTLYRLAHALGISAGVLLDQSPPGSPPGSMDRHEVDRIVKGLISGKEYWPDRMRLRDEVLAQALPLLRACGIRKKYKAKTRNLSQNGAAVRQILERLARQLPGSAGGGRHEKI